MGLPWQTISCVRLQNSPQATPKPHRGGILDDFGRISVLFSQLLRTISASTFDYDLCFFLMHSNVAVADGMAMLGFLDVAILFFGWISDVLDGRGFSLAAFDDVC